MTNNICLRVHICGKMLRTAVPDDAKIIDLKRRIDSDYASLSYNTEPFKCCQLRDEGGCILPNSLFVVDALVNNSKVFAEVLDPNDNNIRDTGILCERLGGLEPVVLNWLQWQGFTCRMIEDSIKKSGDLLGSVQRSMPVLLSLLSLHSCEYGEKLVSRATFIVSNAVEDPDVAIFMVNKGICPALCGILKYETSNHNKLCIALALLRILKGVQALSKEDRVSVSIALLQLGNCKEKEVKGTAIAGLSLLATMSERGDGEGMEVEDDEKMTNSTVGAHGIDALLLLLRETKEIKVRAFAARAICDCAPGKSFLKELRKGEELLTILKQLAKSSSSGRQQVGQVIAKLKTKEALEAFAKGKGKEILMVMAMLPINQEVAKIVGNMLHELLKRRWIKLNVEDIIVLLESQQPDLQYRGLMEIESVVGRNEVSAANGGSHNPLKGPLKECRKPVSKHCRRTFKGTFKGSSFSEKDHNKMRLVQLFSILFDWIEKWDRFAQKALDIIAEISMRNSVKRFLVKAKATEHLVKLMNMRGEKGDIIVGDTLIAAQRRAIKILANIANGDSLVGLGLKMEKEKWRERYRGREVIEMYLDMM
eukprot:g3849.t1